jgi:hypothetical protein
LSDYELPGTIKKKKREEKETMNIVQAGMFGGGSGIVQD